MFIIFILFSFLIIAPSTGQNLVMNPDFEEYWPHKIYYSDIDTFAAKNWYSIYSSYYSTVDYFIKGNRIPSRNVPNNSLGYHPAHSGKAYAGFIPLCIGGGREKTYMEFITGTICEPLKKDKKYEVSFYIKQGGNKCGIYSTKLEVSFSSDSKFFKIKNKISLYDYEYSFYQNVFAEKKITADIIYDNIPLLYDTSSWIKLSNIYTARGGEKYITIGLFYQGKEISKRISKMSDEYQKKFFKPNKRKKILKNIDKQKIPFIKYNPNYEIKKWIVGRKVIDHQPDFGYYFIDDVSVELIKEK
jgi:hypothetical protein